MSSFRIDRQYVSFVTAETRSVFQSGHKSDAMASFTGAGPGVPADEFRRHCAETLERARKQADEQAELMLEQARSDADTIVKNAKKLAEELVGEAQKRAAAIREDAKEAGYSEGQTSARQFAEQTRNKEEKELSRLVSRLKSDYTGLVDSLHGGVVSLTMDIVRKIIGIKLSESDDVFLDLVNNALEQLKQTGAATIHVSSEDYARYFGAGGSVRLGKTEAAVAEEEGYLPGDLVVESESEILDFSIGRQIERVEQAFLQKGIESSGCS